MKALVVLALSAWLAGPVLAQSVPAPAAPATGASAPPPPRSAQPHDPAMLARRHQSIGILIERSSAAQQIDRSGDAAARERRDSARLIHREAGQALDAGEVERAARLLDDAAREMMAGVRLAKPEQVAGEKARRDFDARLESTRALLAAQQRITDEKAASAPSASSRPITREARDATREIERRLAEAQALARQGRIDEARPLLDRAYLTARVSIESLRRGDTLVRSLNFASPREEYDYEIDRNDTHKMLITVLLADRKDAQGAMPPQMQPYVDKAAALRSEAEAQAKAGDHAGAVRTLENATRELVRAIRAGGVYIPG
jgi:tetratricopeptide (TPR) repeat protein